MEKEISLTPKTDANCNDQFQLKSDNTDRESYLSQYQSWVYIYSKMVAEGTANNKPKLYAASKSSQKEITNFTKKSIAKVAQNRIIKEVALGDVEVEQIVDHPILTLLKNASPISNGYELFTVTQLHIDLSGNAFWYIDKDDLGVPTAIYALNPAKVKIVPTKDGKDILGYIYCKQALKKDEVIRFNSPNPSDPFYGKSVVEASWVAIDRQKEMDVAAKATLQNVANPNMIVKYKGNLSAKEKLELQNEWYSFNGGGKNSGLTKVLSDDWSVEPVNMPLPDISYQNGRTITEREIASAFGIPYAMINSADNLKAGLDEMKAQYETIGILPRVQRLEDTLNEQLVPMYDDTGDLFLKYDEVVSINEAAEVEKNIKYVEKGIFTINEVRLQEGLEEVEWGNVPSTANTNSNVAQEAEKVGEVNEEEV